MNTKFKSWRESVVSWWTGQRPLKGEELERTHQLIKEVEDPLFDPHAVYYVSAGVEGAKYWLPRSLKKICAHPLFCALVSVAIGAWLANSSR